MKNKLYSHLVEVDSLHIELDNLDMSDDEKNDVKKMIDESIHHTVLDAILSELSEEDKKTVITHLVSDEHEKMWSFVNEKVDNIEDKIKLAAEDIKKELHHDIKSTKEHHAE